MNVSDVSAGLLRQNDNFASMKYFPICWKIFFHFSSWGYKQTLLIKENCQMKENNKWLLKKIVCSGRPPNRSQNSDDHSHEIFHFFISIFWSYKSFKEKIYIFGHQRCFYRPLFNFKFYARSSNHKRANSSIRKLQNRAYIINRIIYISSGIFRMQ